jgi:hypothetical protein
MPILKNGRTNKIKGLRFYSRAPFSLVSTPRHSNEDSELELERERLVVVEGEVTKLTETALLIFLLNFVKCLINRPPNLPINNATIIPITGIITIIGSHRPSANTGENTSSSFISVALWSRL